MTKLKRLARHMVCGRGAMVILLTAALTPTAPSAEKTDSFIGYVDSDLCAHLMLGPITEGRLQCTKETHKKGSDPVLVRLSDNLVLQVNKQKTLDPLVGQTVTAVGEIKDKNRRFNIGTVSPVDIGTIKPGSPELKLLDIRHFKVTGEDQKIREAVRHELAMLPYISEYDFISFTMADRTVILTGWTLRETNRSSAYNVVKNVKGVEAVVNNIDVLPLGSMDMQIRAGVRAKLQRMLSRYFWGSGSAIKVIVKNGDVILLGVVANKSDSDIANIQANSVNGVFNVFNMLRVESGS